MAHAAAYARLTHLADSLAWGAPHVREVCRRARAPAQNRAAANAWHLEWMVSRAPPSLFVTRAVRAEIAESIAMAQWSFVDARDAAETSGVAMEATLVALPEELSDRLRRLHGAFQRDVDSALIIDEATDIFDDDDMPPVERAAITEDDDDDEMPSALPWTTPAEAEGANASVPMVTDGAEDEQDEGAAERDRERRLRTLAMSGQAPPLTVWPLRLVGSSRVDGAEADDASVESALERWSDVQLSALTEVRAPFLVVILRHRVTPRARARARTQAWILAEESALVALLLHADAAFMFGGGGAPAAEASALTQDRARLHARLRRFVRALVGASGRSPADAQAYQMLVWSLEAAGEQHTRARAVSREAATMRPCALIHRSMSAMLRRWAHALWSRCASSRARARARRPRVGNARVTRADRRRCTVARASRPCC